MNFQKIALGIIIYLLFKNSKKCNDACTCESCTKQNETIEDIDYTEVSSEDILLETGGVKPVKDYGGSGPIVYHDPETYERANDNSLEVV